MSFLKRLTGHCALGLMILTFRFADAAEFEDYSERPSNENNFAEARFRLWVPQNKSPLKGVLFLALGTDSDGLYLASDPEWQKMASELHFGLVSCYLRGEGEPYETASGGSGQALLNALLHFSRKTAHPEVSSLPLILWGHSAGGQFAYTFACWKPERVLGFISLKWAAYSNPPPVATYRVPALIIAGEHDEVGRNQSLAEVYQSARIQKAPWAFLYEKGAGHGLGQTDLICFPFIRALAAGPPTLSFQGELQSGKTGPLQAKNLQDPAISLFPDQQTAHQWQHLHLPCDLNSFKNLSPISPPASGIALSSSVLDFGKIPLDSDPLRKSINVSFKEAGLRDSIQLNIRDKRIQSRATPLKDGFRVDIILDPQRLPIGPYRSEIRVQRISNGKLLEQAELPLYGMVTSDLSAQPASLYLGVMPRNKQIPFKLKIRSNSREPILIQASSSDPDWIRPNVINSSPDALEFECLVQTGDRIGRRYGELRFTLKTDQNKNLVVPYIGFVKKGD